MKLIFCGLLIGLIANLSSCTAGKKSLREHKGSYLESAKLNFEAGVLALKEKEYDKAITYFKFVTSHYPFSQYAALSDLRTADTKFEKKEWLNAASAYEVFIRLHPRHEEVEYASYRLGISYFHAVPADFFILPPATSRDQTFTKEALSAIDRFIVQFPASKYVADAKEKQILLFSYLAKHNQHIADYYARRHRYEAAITRHLAVEKLYPETKEAIESLFLAAEMIETEQKDNARALELYRLIISKNVDSPYTEKARKAIEKLQQEEDIRGEEEAGLSIKRTNLSFTTNRIFKGSRRAFQAREEERSR